MIRAASLRLYNNYPIHQRCRVASTIRFSSAAEKSRGIPLATGAFICCGAAAVVLFGVSTKPWVERGKADELESSAVKYLRRHNQQTPRPDWEEKCRAEGFPFANYPGIAWPSTATYPDSWARQSYWNEEASYEVHPEGMWQIEEASYNIHSMCLEAVNEVVESPYLLQKFGIPEELWPAIRHSWRTRQTDLAGRLDLLWDGENPPKLAEYNADTPTVLVESAGAQRSWFHDVHRGGGSANGQFNVLKEALEAAFQEIQADYEMTVGKASAVANPLSLTFTTQKPSPESEFLEERSTTAYMRDRAARAGLPAEMVDIEDLDDPDAFSSILQAASVEDNLKAPSIVIWKLYPYEWLIQEKLGIPLVNPEFLQGHVRWLEPPWKLVLSSKAMLAYLWEKHPGHQNLVPAFYSLENAEAYAKDPQNAKYAHGKEWVAKPCFGREGLGIMYSHAYEKWSDFRKAVSDSSPMVTEKHTTGFSIPGFLNMNQSGAFFVAKDLNDPSQSSSHLESPVKSLTNKLKKILRDSSLMSDESLNTLLDRSWGSDHVREDETVGFFVGQPMLQAYFKPAELSGRMVVTSAWIVRGVPVAACFREDIAQTTNNDSCFVPHYVPQKGHITGAPREFPVTNDQRQLREELYGVLPISKGLGKEVVNNNEHWEDEKINKPYSLGGVGGRGFASFGGGGGRRSKASWFGTRTSDGHSSIGRTQPLMTGSNAPFSFWNRPGNSGSSTTNRSGERGREAGKKARNAPRKPNNYKRGAFRQTFSTGSTSRGAARIGHTARG